MTDNEKMGKEEAPHTAPEANSGEADYDKNPRYRLSNRALQVIRSYERLGIPARKIIENALYLGEQNLALTQNTVGDLIGGVSDLRTALREYNIITLETFGLLQELELLFERQALLHNMKAVVDAYSSEDSPANENANRKTPLTK